MTRTREPLAETILVVDNDEATRRLTARLLASGGHRVEQAADAVSALELVRSRNSPVRLVVTDVMMPGMSGDELADEIWAHAPLPVLFMSGAADRGDEQDREGPSDFLLKPLQASALLDKVARLLVHAPPAADRRRRHDHGRERLRSARKALPAGRTLPLSEWRRRHRCVAGILWAHAALLTIVGCLVEADLERGAAHGLVLLPFAYGASRGGLSHGARQLLATIGMLTASIAIVHLAHGAVQSHFHYFAVLALLSVYEDWRLFFVAVLAVPVEHALISAVHPAHAGDAWIWVGVHSMAIAIMGMVNVLGWRFNEDVRTAEAKAKLRLAHRALHDELTGLPNRRLLIEELERSAESGCPPSAILFIDLDNFKFVNDSYGHAIGDRLLIDVGARLRSCGRSGDLVARSGGDEFVVVAQSIHDDEQAAAVASRILHALSEPFIIAGVARRINASIGVARFEEGDHSIVDGLARADAAMYSAKNGGRGRACLADDEIVAASVRRARIDDALKACRPEDFTVHYQPIVDLVHGRLAAVEALMRWTHRELGVISPAEFIPRAEEGGRIIELGEWVLDRACRDALRWEALRGEPVRVFVNVSATQLTHPSFGPMVERVLARTGAGGRHVALEMTESAVIDNTSAAMANVAAVRELGLDLILDDFGVGQSSLAQLAGFPFSLIKLDRSFVTEPGNRQQRTMLGAVAKFGVGLGIPSLAEGIETEEQLSVVRGLGFSLAQGFLFCRPQPAQELDRMMFENAPFGGLVDRAPSEGAHA
jgi:diguanylate cyclase